MYKTTASDSSTMPKGIPYIIGNEAAERFSFYGMKTILAVFIANYLHLMGDTATTAMSDSQASVWVHNFNFWVYLTPLLGALLADSIFGKYRIIMWLSVVYCLGHGVLALMGFTCDAKTWMIAGLALITLGSGGIKPCVSAHVGDQFGKNNQHLLTQIFNWFYFSINLGAFLSTLATPLLLKFYGPHIAFGIPGILMALATILFWMGRHKYVHIPAQGAKLFDELAKPGVLFRVLKLCCLFLFVAIFWALFDQSGTSWVFQAQDMDTNLLGIEILPSQLQAFNPIMILSLIPIFTFLIYPQVNKIFPLTPLRKISMGLFLMVASFALITLIQSWIDAGETPSISWQIIAYLLLTSSEVMVSIVCLEFAYTQAPNALKSFLMAIFLLSVALGNILASAINSYIQIDSPFSELTETTTLAGLDGKELTTDDITAVFKDSKLDEILFADSAKFDALANTIKTQIIEAMSLPTEDAGNQIIQKAQDSFGNEIQYEILNSKTARLRSAGADKQPHTKWDTGIMITLNDKPDPDATKTWLDKRKEKLGVVVKADEFTPVTTKAFVGGSSHMTKMEGASYFRFFTYLMLATSVLFIPFSLTYKYNSYGNNQ